MDAEMEFVYDALYQLKEATGREHLALSKTDYRQDSNTFKSAHFANINDANQLRNYTRKYNYDKSGNLTQLKHIGKNSFTRNMTVSDASNRTITDEMNTAIDVDSYFDAAGNLLELDHLSAIAWNYLNNISSATIIQRELPYEDGTLVNRNDAEYYVYNGSGQRTRKVKETYNSAGDLLWIEEKIYLGAVEIKRKFHGTSKTLRESRSSVHIMDDTKRIAMVHFWDVSNDSSTTVFSNKIHYQFGNHLGSASMELDQHGLLISYEEYFPFGGTSFTSGSSASEVKLKEYRYTGKERDDATGLYYYGARYYAPWMARWLNPDPSGTVDGLNLFRYVRNNPVILIDLTGNAPSVAQIQKNVIEFRKSDELKTDAKTKSESFMNLDWFLLNDHHGTVTHLLSGYKHYEDKIPIDYFAAWIFQEGYNLYAHHLGKEWYKQHDPLNIHKADKVRSKSELETLTSFVPVGIDFFFSELEGGNLKKFIRSDFNSGDEYKLNGKIGTNEHGDRFLEGKFANPKSMVEATGAIILYFMDVAEKELEKLQPGVWDDLIYTEQIGWAYMFNNTYRDNAREEFNKYGKDALTKSGSEFAQNTRRVLGTADYLIESEILLTEREKILQDHFREMKKNEQ
ncbi:MAG: hypothetical protein IPL65_20755 [Lewinellaceae bacterium]|nr:hypothetical protein [Lewinellaceae bacterium]